MSKKSSSFLRGQREPENRTYFSTIRYNRKKPQELFDLAYWLFMWAVGQKSNLALFMLQNLMNYLKLVQTTHFEQKLHFAQTVHCSNEFELKFSELSRAVPSRANPSLGTSIWSWNRADDKIFFFLNFFFLFFSLKLLVFSL